MYLLDSNVFIEAKNRYYAFDLAPGFWEWLETDAAAGVIGSIEEVGDELLAGGDDLAAWAQQHPGLFASADLLTVAKLSELAEWANGGQFTQAAVDEFLDVADYYLVAHAAAHGHTVVTHEVYQANARRRVLIPNACQALGVPYCTTSRCSDPGTSGSLSMRPDVSSAHARARTTCNPHSARADRLPRARPARWERKAGAHVWDTWDEATSAIDCRLGQTERSCFQ
jgi:predicted nucleic acid-binding protein